MFALHLYWLLHIAIRIIVMYFNDLNVNTKKMIINISIFLVNYLHHFLVKSRTITIKKKTSEKTFDETSYQVP